MLQILLQKAMQEHKPPLSSHKAADLIGVSHSTILRALRGDTVDVDTIIKIANWLNVRPSELLNSMSDASTLSEQIAVILSHSPALEEELKEAVRRVKNGSLDPEILRDITSYALYKIGSSGDINVRGTKVKGSVTGQGANTDAMAGRVRGAGNRSGKRKA